MQHSLSTPPMLMITTRLANFKKLLNLMNKEKKKILPIIKAYVSMGKFIRDVFDFYFKIFLLKEAQCLIIY